MLEKSDLQYEKIVASVWDTYGIPIEQVALLPIGADVNAAVYRLATSDKTNYFFKIKAGPFDETCVTLPKFFCDTGVSQIIPPQPTRNGQLWGQLDSYKTILYPFIEGKNGYEVVLSDKHWAEFGKALKRIHTLTIPQEIVGRIHRERYSDEGRKVVMHSLEWMETEIFVDSVANEMAQFMKAKRLEITDLVERAEKLARILKANPPNMIVCHSDLHAGNIFIGDDDAFYIVDWDEPILAPKERDLMGVGGGLMASKRSPQEEEELFYQSYGQITINETAIAYYRYERIIQDIYEYCKQLIKSVEGGEIRQQSLYFLKSDFFPGHTIDIAYRSDRNTYA